MPPTTPTSSTTTPPGVARPGRAVRLVLNGEAVERPPGTTVARLLEGLGLRRDGVAVAVNRRVVPRSTHDEHVLQDDDHVEVIQAVGGG